MELEKYNNNSKIIEAIGKYMVLKKDISGRKLIPITPIKDPRVMKYINESIDVFLNPRIFNPSFLSSISTITARP